MISIQFSNFWFYFYKLKVTNFNYLEKHGLVENEMLQYLIGKCVSSVLQNNSLDLTSLSVWYRIHHLWSYNSLPLKKNSHHILLMTGYQTFWNVLGVNVPDICYKINSQWDHFQYDYNLHGDHITIMLVSIDRCLFTKILLAAKYVVLLIGRKYVMI